MELKTDDIKTILHQATPYLLVDEVSFVDENKIKVIKNHSGDEFYVKGHFPSAPVVPGAMLQEMSTQAAGILITRFHSPVENYNSLTTKGWALGVLKKVNYAKFFSMTSPSRPIQIEVYLDSKVDNLFSFTAKITQDGEKKAILSFKLANISDKHLYS